MSELKTTSLSHKDNNTGTPNITMYPDGTTSLGLTYTGGFKNQIINGDFRVWQRGNPITLSVASGSDELYSADRWAMGVGSGNSITVTRSTTAPSGFAYSMLTTNAGAVQQGVELPEAGNAGAFAIGTTWTFSVWHNQDITSRNPDPKFRDSVATPGNDSAAGTASNWVSTGETSTSGGVTFTRYFSTVTINAAPNSTNLVLNFYISGGAHFSDASTYFTGVQFEPGPVATPFEHRPIGTELSLCQRYYQKYDSRTFLYRTTSYETQKVAVVYYKTTMRIPPSAVINDAGSGGTTVWSGNSTTEQGYLTNGDSVAGKPTYCSLVALDAEL